MRTKSGLALSAVTLTALLAVATAAPAHAQPHVIVHAPRRIAAFAESRSTIVWRVRGGTRLHFHDLKTGTRSAIGMFPRPTDPTLCEAGPHVRGIAISGTHAIWRWEAFAEASSCDEDAITFHAVATADIADAAATSLADWGQLYCPFDANDTRYVSAVDASGSQLVYSTVHQGCPGGPITGDVTLVANGIQTTVPGSPAAARLSASRSRVAWVAASAANLDGLGEPVGLPAVAPQTAIQVFDTATDAVATSVMPRGTVRSIALSGTVLAALVRRPSGEKVMVRYRIPDGQHLGTTRVSPRTPPSIDMAGSMIVFTVGRHILAMNATSGQTRLVATGQHQPIDVSIAGRRIAWIENGRRSGKIIATTA